MINFFSKKAVNNEGKSIFKTYFSPCYLPKFELFDEQMENLSFVNQFLIQV